MLTTKIHVICKYYTYLKYVCRYYVCFFSRPFKVRKIWSTNLILLVVNDKCNNKINKFDDVTFDTVPQEVNYEEHNTSLSCHKASNSLPRCRPKTACIKTHPDVSNNV